MLCANLALQMSRIDALEMSRRGVSLHELAERTGLHQRSIRRYLSELESFAVVEVVRDDDQTRWRCPPTKRGTRFPFSLAECLALGRIVGSLSAARGADRITFVGETSECGSCSGAGYTLRGAGSNRRHRATRRTGRQQTRGKLGRGCGLITAKHQLVSQHITIVAGVDAELLLEAPRKVGP